MGVGNYLGPAVTHFGAVYIATPYVLAFAAVIGAAAAIELFQRYTLWGRLMRAVGENREAVRLAGANVVALGAAAFVIGSALAGIAGFVIAPVTFAQSSTGLSFAILVPQDIPFATLWLVIQPMTLPAVPLGEVAGSNRVAE